MENRLTNVLGQLCSGRPARPKGNCGTSVDRTTGYKCNQATLWQKWRVLRAPFCPTRGQTPADRM